MGWRDAKVSSYERFAVFFFFFLDHFFWQGQRATVACGFKCAFLAVEKRWTGGQTPRGQKRGGSLSPRAPIPHTLSASAPGAPQGTTCLCVSECQSVTHTPPPPSPTPPLPFFFLLHLVPLPFPSPPLPSSPFPSRREFQRGSETRPTQGARVLES